MPKFTAEESSRLAAQDAIHTGAKLPADSARELSNSLEAIIKKSNNANKQAMVQIILDSFSNLDKPLSPDVQKDVKAVLLLAKETLSRTLLKEASLTQELKQKVGQVFQEAEQQVTGNRVGSRR